MFNNCKSRDETRRRRGENWTQEEKALFLKVVGSSAPIIECKLTDTNSNKKKYQEWVRIQNKLFELTGKYRDVPQIKGIWRRMKIPKKDMNVYEGESKGTGDSLPQAPEDDSMKIINPIEFFEETNTKYDCDRMDNDVYDTDYCEEVDVNTNIEFKKRRLSQMKEEHSLKLQYHQQELAHQQKKHKLELELLGLHKKIKLTQLKILVNKLEKDCVS